MGMEQNAKNGHRDILVAACDCCDVMLSKRMNVGLRTDDYISLSRHLSRHAANGTTIGAILTTNVARLRM